VPVIGKPLANIARGLRQFADDELAARSKAARKATITTRSIVSRTMRPRTIARRGRNFPILATNLRWNAGQDSSSAVEFDIADADTRMRFWIVQEIGTNERAIIKHGGSSNPGGRPKKGATYVRSVRTQRGRAIGHGGLAFGTGPVGKWTRPGAARGQQIQVARNLSGIPPWAIGRLPRIIIQREIVGKHMVALGAEAGFRQYETDVLTAARRAFGGFS
jgi:hypothetical protein